MLFAIYIIEFIGFDVVPFIDQINDRFLTTYFCEDLPDKTAMGYGLLGFETHNFAKNSGSLYLIILWMIATSAFFYVVRRFADNYFCVPFYIKYRTNENLIVLLVSMVL
jgi:hypothetical protein